MRNEINLTDEQIEYLFDKLGTYECVEEMVFTRETLADFESARQNYNEKGRINEQGAVEGYPYIQYEGVQPFKGQQRSWLSIIDFGDVRVVVR